MRISSGGYLVVRGTRLMSHSLSAILTYDLRGRVLSSRCVLAFGVQRVEQ